MCKLSPHLLCIFMEYINIKAFAYAWDGRSSRIFGEGMCGEPSLPLKLKQPVIASGYNLEGIFHCHNDLHDFESSKESSPLSLFSLEFCYSEKKNRKPPLCTLLFHCICTTQQLI